MQFFRQPARPPRDVKPASTAKQRYIMPIVLWGAQEYEKPVTAPSPPRTAAEPHRPIE